MALSSSTKSLGFVGKGLSKRVCCIGSRGSRFFALLFVLSLNCGRDDQDPRL